MSRLLPMFGDLLKAATAVVLAPAAAVVDTVMLPADATDCKVFFGRTGEMLRKAGEHAKEAVR